MRLVTLCLQQSLSRGQILDQILKLGPTSADKQSDGTRTMHPGSTGPEESEKAESSSDIESDSDEARDPWPEFKLHLKIESRSDLQSDSDDSRIQQFGSRSTEDTGLESEIRELSPVSRTKVTGDVLASSKSEETRDLDLKLGSEAPGTRNLSGVLRPGSRLDQTGCTADELETSVSETTDFDPEPPSPGQRESLIWSLEQTGERRPTLSSQETTDLPPGPNALGARDLQVASRLQQGSEIKPDLYLESAVDVKPEPTSVQTGNGDLVFRVGRVPQLTSRLGLKSEETPGPESQIQEACMSEIKSDSGSGQKTKPDADLRSTSDQPRTPLDPKPKQDRGVVPMSARADVQATHSQCVVGSGEEHRPREGSGYTVKEVLDQQSGPGSEVIYRTAPEEESHRQRLTLSWEHVMDEVTS